MIAHAQHDPVAVLAGLDLDRLVLRIEAQCIAQQIVQCPLKHGRPALQAQPGLFIEANLLLRCAQLGILLHAEQQRRQVDRFGAGMLGIEPRQGKNFADQGFQAIALTGQARPEFFPLLGLGPLRQGQGDAQARQGGAQLMGHIAQQLPLAADQALQPRTHAVEVIGQDPELIPAVGQLRQAVLLVGRLSQIMHGAAQSTEGAGDRQRHQQAEQGQHHQCDTQGAEWPEQAFAMPGVEFRMRNAVDQQIGFTAFGAGVFDGEATPGQLSVVVTLARLEGRGPAREGSRHHGIAVLVEYLDIDVILAPALFQVILGILGAIFFVALGPGLGEGVDARMATENPGVLVQHVPEQQREPGDERDGKPEAGKDPPEH